MSLLFCIHNLQTLRKHEPEPDGGIGRDCGDGQEPVQDAPRTSGHLKRLKYLSGLLEGREREKIGRLPGLGDANVEVRQKRKGRYERVATAKEKKDIETVRTSSLTRST